jgi:hypothetical protein
VFEDPPYDGSVGEERDELALAATPGTGERVDLEDALQELGPAGALLRWIGPERPLGEELRWRFVAHPALVMELRAKLQAGAEQSPSNMRHYAVLRFDDGRQAEHECLASALASLAPGALGVAYLKGERLAAFVRMAA